ncbi:MAG: hypothetical protein ACXWPX_09145, partial [Pseudobdellovibrio sp.]
MMGKVTAKTIFYFLASAVLLTALLIYSQNTVSNNQKWIPQKIMMAYPPGSPMEPIQNRGMLALGRLNLQKYGGFQEVYYSKSVDLKKVKI